MKSKYCAGAALLLCAAVAACASDVPTATRTFLTLERALPTSCFCDFGVPSFNSYSGAAGQTIPVVLVVHDQTGKEIEGVTVRWSVAPGNGTTDVAVSVSDTGGVVTANWTLPTVVGMDSLRASLPFGATVVNVATAHNGAPAIALKVSGDSQTVAAGAPAQPLVLHVTDKFGNGIPGMTIAWSIAGAAGTLRGPTSKTDTAGTTSNILTTGAVPGNYRVIATFGTMPAITFTVITN